LLPAWEDSVQYTLRLYVTDQAGNLQTSTTHQFYCDQTGPEVVICAPYAARQSSLPTISGTTQDDTNGVDEVKLRILNMTCSKYWDGSAFNILDADKETAWFIARTTTTVPWDIWFNTFTWQNGRQYRIEAKVKDSAGNYGLSYATQTYIYDPDIPESYVVYPPAGSMIKGLPYITGTAHDTGSINPGTLTQTLIAIKRNSDGKWWDGATDFSSPAIDYRLSAALRKAGVILHNQCIFNQWHILLYHDLLSG